MIQASINQWTANQMQINTITNILNTILLTVIAIELGYIIYKKYFKK